MKHPKEHNPYLIVEEFERRIAKWAGSKYAVAVESGTAAIFLSLMYRKFQYGNIGTVEIPKHTYPSVPASIIHARGKVKFVDSKWSGSYFLDPLGIVDGALTFRKGMYIPKTLYCLSFHIKKHLPIGRGGMILTDDIKARDWLRLARFDGRKPVPLLEDDLKILGWNAYMEPAQAARGIQLFEVIRNKKLKDLDVGEQGYPDLSRFKIFQ